MNKKKSKRSKVVTKRVKEYFCDICDFKCRAKFNYNRHLLTPKHIMKTSKKEKNACVFKCVNCGKGYKQSQGLSRHKKKCKNECNINVTNVTKNVTNVTKFEMSKMKCPESERSENSDNENLNNENSDNENLNNENSDNENLSNENSDNENLSNENLSNENLSNENMVIKLVEKFDKVQKKFQETVEKKDQIIETQTCKLYQLMDFITKNGMSNINTNNNKSHNVNSLNTQNNNLTVNVYLNEHCKDAMNIKDFVEKVKVSLDDLQYTTDNGFAEGISNIFMKQLNDMKPTERPIHCADAKRCKFYVKDENNDWKKDAENKKIDKSISEITLKQIKMLKVWEGEHPSWNSNTILSMHRQEIICKIMGGRDMGDQAKNRKKIKQMIGETIKLKEAMAQASALQLA